MAGRLAKLPNLGPASERMLHAAGIMDADQLRQLGPAAAYLAVRECRLQPSLNLLWAVEGALAGIHWSQVTDARKQELLLEIQR